MRIKKHIDTTPDLFDWAATNTATVTEDKPVNKIEKPPFSEEKRTIVVIETATVPISKTQKSIPEIFRIFEADRRRTASQIISDNINAVKILKSKSHYSVKEKLEMMKFAGWGNCADIFSHSNKTLFEDPSFRKYYRDVKHLEEYKILRNLLSEKEIEEAEKSTLTAYYTPDYCIKTIYKILEKLGFKGGKILEPAAGTGRFISMSPEHFNARWTAVEMDTLSAQILAALQKNIDVINSPFQDYKCGHEVFDAVITNVPFASYRPCDQEHNQNKFKLHDYFLAKSIEVLKPGGIMAVLTATSTLDNSPITKFLYAKGASLLCAFRLPEETFETTETMADILIFAKIKEDNPIWTKSEFSKIIDEKTDRELEEKINNYYTINKNHMLGSLTIKFRHYGPVAVLENNSPSTEKLLNEAINKINWDTLRSRITKSRESNNPVIKNHDNPVNENYTNQIAEDTKSLSQTLRTLLRTSAVSNDDGEIKKLQNQLSNEYDMFVFKNGYINNNIKYLRNMADFPNLLALEIYDSDTKTARKAEIFTKRIISPVRRIEKAENAEDALWISINEYGNINIQRIAELIGKTEDDAVSEMLESDNVFINPETEELETRSEYLSGKVKNKLEIARQAAEKDKTYERNCRELLKVQPERLSFDKIKCRPGAAWVPEQVIEEFLSEITEIPVCKWSVKHCAQSGTWLVNCSASSRDNIKNTSEYGFDDMSGDEIFKRMLNGQSIKIFRKDSHGNRYFDPKATAVAHEKMSKIEKYFETWLRADEERKNKLEDLYNEIFNTEIPRVYDCKKLDLPGMADKWKERINTPERKYQKNSIYRAIHGGSMLLAHCVGAGKTLEMAAIGMELKRLKLAMKPLYVVPNHALEQWAREFKEIYPEAQVMIVYKDLMLKEKRQQTTARIAMNDYDAVIMAHSTFNKIGVSEELEKDYLHEQIDELEFVISEAETEEGKSATRRSVKQLQKMKINLEEKFKKLSSSENKDQNIQFEELNVDYLFIDEAHNFKGIPIYTKKGNISGIQIQTSQKAMNMELKTIFIRNLHKGKRGIVFATGTPISNSISEAYVMMRYIDPDNMKEKGIHSFDDWAGTFGKTVTELEIKPTGSGYRTNTRFSDFSNLPELKKMFRKFADIVRIEDIKINRPEMINGKPECVKCQMSDAQKDYVKSLVKRSEKLSTGHVDPREDNMLKITTEARKLSLSSHLLGISDEHAENKIMLCATNIFKIWKKTSEIKGTQLVFSDLGVPDEGNYSVYQDLKNKLITMGIHENEIKFIHDADTDMGKAELFKAVRNGSCRILIGNTQKMGEGTNVQTLLVALHNLDVPWKPAHYEQRLGRILRPGNTNKEVAIYNYASEESFDAYMWQTVERKAKGISKFMDPSLTEREYEGDSTSFTAAEMKAIASENPIVREKTMLEISLQKLILRKEAMYSDKYQKERTIRSNEYDLRKFEENIKIYMEISSMWQNANKELSIKFDDKTLIEKDELLKHFQNLKSLMEIKKDGQIYAGQLFDKIEIIIKRDFSDTIIKIRYKCHEITATKFSDTNSESFISTFKRNLSELENEIKTESNKYNKLKKQLDELKNDTEDKRFTELEKEIESIRTRLSEIEHELQINEDDMQADAMEPDSGEDNTTKDKDAA